MTENKFISDSLFPDWVPFGPVGRTLSRIGLTDEEVSLFEVPFERFRHQEPDSPLRLPEDIRTSDDWFRLLFRDIQRGYISQRNHDNIGRDFLCLIYYRQRILDLMRDGGLKEVLNDILREQMSPLPEHINLNNSLIPVEALTDYLILSGFPMTGPVQEAVILSDPPQRRLTLKEVPSFRSMLTASTNLSRYIRNLSVCLQDGGKWEDLIQIKPQRYNLPDEMFVFGDRRRKLRTEIFGRDIALNREFCLWDINRGERLPSVRTISNEKGVPYIQILRLLRFGDSNGDRGGISIFEGLRFLSKGFGGRLSEIFLNDLSKTKQKGDIL